MSRNNQAAPSSGFVVFLAAGALVAAFVTAYEVFGPTEQERTSAAALKQDRLDAIAKKSHPYEGLDGDTFSIIDLQDKCANQFKQSVAAMIKPIGSVNPSFETFNTCAMLMIAENGRSSKVTWDINAFNSTCKSKAADACKPEAISLAVSPR